MSDAKFTGPMRDTYLLKAAKEKQSERNTESLTPRRNPGFLYAFTQDPFQSSPRLVERSAESLNLTPYLNPKT